MLRNQGPSGRIRCCQVFQRKSPQVSAPEANGFTPHTPHQAPHPAADYKSASSFLILLMLKHALLPKPSQPPRLLGPSFHLVRARITLAPLSSSRPPSPSWPPPQGAWRAGRATLRSPPTEPARQTGRVGQTGGQTGPGSDPTGLNSRRPTRRGEMPTTEEILHAVKGMKRVRDGPCPLPPPYRGACPSARMRRSSITGTSQKPEATPSLCARSSAKGSS